MARNRVIDLLRRREPLRFGDAVIEGSDGQRMRIEDLIPSEGSDPEAEYARERLLEELQRALSELPEEQRSVFVAHEVQGKSFKQIAAQSGINVNTLLARKRYAVLHLRERLPVFVLNTSIGVPAHRLDLDVALANEVGA